MCTAISLNAGDHYFGRNLDYDRYFGEKAVITPRKYAFSFTNGELVSNHSGIIGMAITRDNYPLYFDAANEDRLSMAGLNFPGNAKYFKPDITKNNIASFEFIPYILCKCKTTAEAKELIGSINITDQSFSSDMPPAPLHWIISDALLSITVEQTSDGLRIFDNPIGVLTNNPTFDFHMINLSNYMGATADIAQNRFTDKINLPTHSTGMGGIGIPGDLSSVSRFIRASFIKLNSVCESTEDEAVNQFFHILYSVYHTKGSVKTPNGHEITYYSSCCNTATGTYYYTTYNNFTVNKVSIHDYDLDSDALFECSLIR